MHSTAMSISSVVTICVLLQQVRMRVINLGRLVDRLGGDRWMEGGEQKCRVTSVEVEYIYYIVGTVLRSYDSDPKFARVLSDFLFFFL